MFFRVMVGAFLVAALGTVRADTFTSKTTGEKLEGRFLGSTTRNGQKYIIAKLDNGLRELPADQWTINRDEPSNPPRADHEPKARTEPRPDPEFRWPEVVYNGKPRDTEWLETSYEHFAGKVALVDGKFHSLGAVDIWEAVVARKVQFLSYGRGGRTHFVFDVGPKRRGQIFGPLRLEVGDCALVSGKVLQVLGEDALILSADSQDRQSMRVKSLSTEGIVDGKYWHGIVLAVGTYRYVAVNGAARTILDCRLVPKERRPLTREQFAEALREGVTLSLWKLEKGKTPRTVLSREEGAVTQWRYELRSKPVQ